MVENLRRGRIERKSEKEKIRSESHPVEFRSSFGIVQGGSSLFQTREVGGSNRGVRNGNALFELPHGMSIPLFRCRSSSGQETMREGT